MYVSLIDVINHLLPWPSHLVVKKKKNKQHQKTKFSQSGLQWWGGSRFWHVSESGNVSLKDHINISGYLVWIFLQICNQSFFKAGSTIFFKEYLLSHWEFIHSSRVHIHSIKTWSKWETHSLAAGLLSHLGYMWNYFLASWSVRCLLNVTAQFKETGPHVAPP